MPERLYFCSHLGWLPRGADIFVKALVLEIDGKTVRLNLRKKAELDNCPCCDADRPVGIMIGSESLNGHLEEVDML